MFKLKFLQNGSFLDEMSVQLRYYAQNIWPNGQTLNPKVIFLQNLFFFRKNTAKTFVCKKIRPQKFRSAKKSYREKSIWKKFRAKISDRENFRCKKNHCEKFRSKIRAKNRNQPSPNKVKL